MQLRYTLAWGSLSVGSSTGQGREAFCTCTGHAALRVFVYDIPLCLSQDAATVVPCAFVCLFVVLKSLSCERGVEACFQDCRWLGGRRASA